MTDNATNESDRIDQACAIPFRRHEPDGEIEVCLITSISKGRWGFPKGIIDSGETAEDTAMKEAEEEAGLSGDILGPPLGTYRYHKWGTTLFVTVYLMSVTHTTDDWEEAHLRKRLWTTPSEAETLLHRPDHRDMLAEAVTRWNVRLDSAH